LVTLQELAKSLQGEQADASNEEVHTIFKCHGLAVRA
jgi:hypothetical protein